MTNKKRKVESEGRVVTKQIEPTIPIDNVNASYCATLLLDTLVKQLWQNTLSKTLATLDGVGKMRKQSSCFQPGTAVVSSWMGEA